MTDFIDIKPIYDRTTERKGFTLSIVKIRN